MASFLFFRLFMYEVILTDVQDHILTITLNRPDHLNFFNQQSFIELMDVFEKVNQDDAIRCIIITGAGILTLKMFGCYKPIIPIPVYQLP